MKNDSLEKARDTIIEAISNLDINGVDKAELMVNLFHFLDKDKYKKNIQILKLKKENEK